MNKGWVRYVLLAVLFATFIFLWVASGDWVRALILLVILVLVGAFLVAILRDVMLEIPLWYRRLSGVPFADYLNRLETRGKAVRDQYHAVAALTVEDFSTGRLMHFIDIGNGEVLLLYGQQYYEFEPIDDDPGANQDRQFPTGIFSLVRDARKDEVLALFPGAEVIEPTICAPVSKPGKLAGLGFQLIDGEVVSDVSLEAVERTLQAAG